MVLGLAMMIIKLVKAKKMLKKLLMDNLDMYEEIKTKVKEAIKI